MIAQSIAEIYGIFIEELSINLSTVRQSVPELAIRAAYHVLAFIIRIKREKKRL